MHRYAVYYLKVWIVIFRQRQSLVGYAVLDYTQLFRQNYSPYPAAWRAAFRPVSRLRLNIYKTPCGG
jgi:hypothetical protein